MNLFLVTLTSQHFTYIYFYFFVVGLYDITLQPGLFESELYIKRILSNSVSDGKVVES